MNKKRVFACMLAIWMMICLLTSCNPNSSDSQTTESSSESSSEQKPNDSAISFSAFADLLENALNTKQQLSVDYHVRQHHIYSEISFARVFLEIHLEADLRFAEQPCFAYSIRNDERGEDLFLFYHDGYLYRKETEMQYKYPLSWEKAKEGLPSHPFLGLFGENWKAIFANAEITEAENGYLTANAQIDLHDYLENAKKYLKFFGGNHDRMTEYDALSPISFSVTIDENGRILSLSVDMTMDSVDNHGRTYPVDYNINAEFHEISDDFAVSVPTESERAEYPESEPDISEITLSDFVRRFFLANANAGKAVYTQMITVGNAVYDSGDTKFEVPYQNITQVDNSNPKKPHVSMVETLNFFGFLQHTEIYYKDEIYYYSIGGEKFSVSYPAEEYLANVEASAKEKAEAGISTFFMSDLMLSHAILTINPDQSVSALISFDGETQRASIFHNIKSVYNDDFNVIPGAQISDARVCMTLNRFNQMTAYFMEVTVSAETSAGPSVVKYSIEYQMEYSEQPREIVFPDGLNQENYPLRAQ